MTVGLAPRPTPTEAPAIDFAVGMDRVMGDRGMFERVLARFRNEYRLAAVTIRAALLAGDVSLAERLAHTLKGASGMIDAGALQQQARVLELAIRGNSADCEPQLGRLETELNRAMCEVDAMLVATKVQATRGSPAESA